MIKLDYIVLIILVLCWTLTPFFRKRAITRVTNEEYFIVNFILTSSLTIMVWFYLIRNGKANYNIFGNMTFSEILWAFLSSFLSVVSAICLILLIKNNEITHIIPKLSPCVLILTCLFGVYIFGEKLDPKKIISIILIISGLALFHY